MKSSLLFLTLLAAGLGRASAQNQVPGGTPLMVQGPQMQTPPQVQPAVTFVLAYPLLAMPETSPMPSRVKLTLSRPADTLEVLGQPRGMTVTITQDTVTVETKAVPVGQYPLRITGRWGNETKAVELLVSVYALSGTVAPITGPAEPGPTIPTAQPATTQTTATQSTATPTPTVRPVQITPPTATVTTAAPAPADPAPVPATGPEIRPIQAAPSVPAPAQPLPPVTVTAPAPVVPQAPVLNAVPNAGPTAVPAPVPTPVPTPVQAAPVAPSIPTTVPTTTVPYQTPPVRVAESGGRFTVWGGMGTERGIVGGLNVGVSSPVARLSAFQVAVRGTAELYPNAGAGLGLPVLGADVLLSREGSRLYYGPSTSLAFGAGNSWAVGGLVGYSSTWNRELGYYLEGRARYAHLGGQNTLSPGFRVGFTYRLGR